MLMHLRNWWDKIWEMFKPGKWSMFLLTAVFRCIDLALLYDPLFIKTVYKRVRGWTSGQSLPVLNFKYPPPTVWEKFNFYIKPRTPKISFMINWVGGLDEKILLSNLARAHNVPRFSSNSNAIFAGKKQSHFCVSHSSRQHSVAGYKLSKLWDKSGSFAGHIHVSKNGYNRTTLVVCSVCQKVRATDRVAYSDLVPGSTITIDF